MPGLPGAPTLSFEAFDAQAGEVSVWLNWNKIADVTATSDTAWGPSQSVVIPDKYLNDTADNYIQFVATGDFPNWRTWGVRNVSLTP